MIPRFTSYVVSVALVALFAVPLLTAPLPLPIIVQAAEVVDINTATADPQLKALPGNIQTEG